MIPILVTAMICSTLLVISKFGVDIRITKNYNQTFKDETPKEDFTTGNTDLDKEIKKSPKENKQFEEFVNDTVNVFEDYFNEGKEENDGQGKEVERA